MAAALAIRGPLEATAHNIGCINSEEQNAQNLTIQGIVKRCLIEFAAATALAVFCCCFVATPAAIAMIANGLVIQTLVGLILKMAAYCFASPSQTTSNQPIPTAVKWLDAGCFVTGSVQNTQIVVHEAGHALAIHALLKNAKPTITLFPFAGGVTQAQGQAITWLGQKIGPNNIFPVISGAGPFCSLALSTSLLAIGLAKRESSPEISRMLIVAALADFLTHILYALSALKARLTNFSHDFVALWQLAGIHPLIAAITMATVPILMLIAHTCCAKHACS